MGIRFYCPACGHKLNVKAFLAGKRGVCPQCGAGLDIPLESRVGKDAKKEAASKPPGREKNDSAVSNDSMTVPVARPASENSQPDGRPASVPTSSEPVMATVASSREAQTASSPVGPLAVPVGPAVRVRPASPERPATPVATPVTAAPVDPIEESPESSWYVRPPSGGQYGPARGDIMRKWMAEGRVSSDSLVWREGWEDWRTACEVFRSLGSVAVPPMPAPAPYSPGAPAASSIASRRPRRSNSTARAIAVLVVLGLMCLGLLITLVIVIRS